MKKILYMVIMPLLFAYPVFSQEDDIEEVIPVGMLILKNKDIPASLQSAVEKSYKNGNAFQWYSFPYLLKEYGWAFKKDMTNTSDNSKQDLYAVQIKTTQGTIDAVYTEDGKLIRSKELMKDVELPTSVLKAFEKTEYKNGKIVEDKLKITNAKNNKLYYSIVVQKEGKKHTLYFDKDGNRLRNAS